jgi:hypothetical protein
LFWQEWCIFSKVGSNPEGSTLNWWGHSRTHVCFEIARTQGDFKITQPKIFFQGDMFRLGEKEMGDMAKGTELALSSFLGLSAAMLTGLLLISQCNCVTEFPWQTSFSQPHASQISLPPRV